MIVPIHRSDLIWSFSRSSGAGGQNVNKVNSKAEGRWLIEAHQGITPEIIGRFKAKYGSKFDSEGYVIVSSDRLRDRERNISDCLNKLNEWLASVWYPPKKRIKTQPTRGSKRRRLNEKRQHAEKKSERSFKGQRAKNQGWSGED